MHTVRDFFPKIINYGVYIMKLGAQFFTLREQAKTKEGLKNCFEKVKNIGYQAAQMSAICEIEAELLRDYSEEYALPITCTHIAYDKIINNTDKIIKDHITYKCPVVGLGSMPQNFRGSIEGARAFLKEIAEPMKKIEAAGLKFAYHNHAFEFDDLGGVRSYDILIEEAPTLNFILDTYWVRYAGEDYMKYIKLFGTKRMTNIHFKDMRTEPKGEICPCGEGVIDFAPITALCKEIGVPYALVEQDNAPKLGDEFEQMATSFNNLKHLF